MKTIVLPRYQTLSGRAVLTCVLWGLFFSFFLCAFRYAPGKFTYVIVLILHVCLSAAHVTLPFFFMCTAPFTHRAILSSVLQQKAYESLERILGRG